MKFSKTKFDIVQRLHSCQSTPRTALSESTFETTAPWVHLSLTPLQSLKLTPGCATKSCTFTSIDWLRHPVVDEGTSCADQKVGETSGSWSRLPAESEMYWMPAKLACAYCP